MKQFTLLLLSLLPLFLAAQPLQRVKPEKVGMSSRQLRYADEAIGNAIANGDIPGAVLAVVRHGKMAYLKAYGHRQVYPTLEPMTTGTVFDMASCSKVIATATCAMILVERGQLRLSDAVSRYIPDFEDWKSNDGKESQAIRVDDLLTHSSGLPAYAPTEELSRRYGAPSPQGLMDYICHVRRDSRPKTAFRYSCLNFITLQHIIETITHQSLRDFARQHIFDVLGMDYTDYLPCAPDANGKWQNTSEAHWARRMPSGADWRSIVAPTTREADDSVLQAQVHDPLARIMNGGVSGNAGLFTRADDVALFCAALQNGGEWRGRRILSPAGVRALHRVPRSVAHLGRTLGWDSYSDYSSNKGDLFDADGVICHTGFTGTNVVVDADTDTSVILLINSVHPEEGHSVVRLRSLVSSVVAASIVE